LATQRESLNGIHCPALLPGAGDHLVQRICILVHRRRQLLPLRLLGRRDLELGLEEGDAPVDQLAGQHSRMMMAHRRLCRFRCRRRRSVLREGRTQPDRGNARQQGGCKKWGTELHDR
jgi:hypothetical protein